MVPAKYISDYGGYREEKNRKKHGNCGGHNIFMPILDAPVSHCYSYEVAMAMGYDL